MQPYDLTRTALVVGVLLWTESALSAGWKYPPPSDAVQSCAQVSVPPGRTASRRMPLPGKAGAWFMEGQWQHECRQAAPGGAYLAVYDHGTGWIQTTCYVPRQCNGPPASFGIPRGRPGVY